MSDFILDSKRVGLPATGNRFTKPADDWYHIIPEGEFPHKSTGVLQICDRIAHESIVRNFQAAAQKPNFVGVLVDYDHFSYDPEKPSDAAGWIEEMQYRHDDSTPEANGSWGKIRWSEGGERDVDAGKFRLVSPAFRPDESQLVSNRSLGVSKEAILLNSSKVAKGEQSVIKIRPLKLDTLALTNAPNMCGMVPLSNRDAALDITPAKPKAKRMESVCKELGLSPDASEDAVLAEVKRHKARSAQADTAAETLKNRNAILEKDNGELLAVQIESDLELYKNRFPANFRDRMKEGLLANRASTVEWLKAQPEIKAAAAPAVIHNRTAASDAIARRNSQGGIAKDALDDTPPTPEQLEALSARSRLIGNRASALLKESLHNRNGRQWDACWKQAESELIAKS